MQAATGSLLAIALGTGSSHRATPLVEESAPQGRALPLRRRDAALAYAAPP